MQFDITWIWFKDLPRIILNVRNNFISTQITKLNLKADFSKKKIINRQNSEAIYQTRSWIIYDLYIFGAELGRSKMLNWIWSDLWIHVRFFHTMRAGKSVWISLMYWEFLRMASNHSHCRVNILNYLIMRFNLLGIKFHNCKSHVTFLWIDILLFTIKKSHFILASTHSNNIFYNFNIRLFLALMKYSILFYFYLSRGLCCQLQRRHRQAPRKVMK